VKAVKKAIVLLFALLLMFCSIGPMPHTYAAKITRFNLFVKGSLLEIPSYLIAGYEYVAYLESDKAGTTSVELLRYEYSTDNGSTWLPLPGVFAMPVDPQLTSAIFRASAYFDPIIGSKSYSEKTIGPYKILQPAELTDVTATANDDGTVTLKWNDNSNMESYYQITRQGPDGTKTFTVNNTMERIGPLSYVDKQTNHAKSTVYVYSLSAIIDKYSLPADLQPGTVYVTAKTKVPLDPEKILLDSIKVPDLIVPGAIDSKSDLIIADSNVSKYIEKYNLYIEDHNKAAVSGVKLDKTELSLKIGESAKLTATVAPSNAANQQVTWSSGNSQVAEVDSSGKVTGKAPGTAKITVKTESGGFAAVCTVTVTGMPESKPLDPAPIVAPQFADISGHKASEEIVKAVELDIVRGYDDGTFRPDANVTRAEFAVMLMRAIKPALEGTPLTFTDKDEIGVWAVQPVAQAVQLGIIKGYDDGTFQPNANITHAEMIAMVVRSSGLAVGQAKQTGLADDADIPEWVKPSVSKAQETGIIIVGGLPDNKFSPQVPSTRAEAASSIVRMLKIRK